MRCPWIGVAVALLLSSAASGLSIESQVLGLDNRGLAGARVELRPVLRVYDQGLRDLEGKGEPDPVAVAVTNSDGWFCFALSSEGPWRIMVTAAGFPAMKSSPRIVLGEETLEPVRMGRITFDGAGPWGPHSPPPAARRIAGSQVWPLEVHESGKPVPGALVRDMSRWLVLGRTDRKGSLLLDVPLRNALNLRVETRDGRLAPFSLPAIPETARDRRTARKLDLPPAIPLAGRVVDQSNGRPIPGARVWSAADPAAFQVADASGSYQLPGGVVNAPVVLGAVAEGHLFSEEAFLPQGDRLTPPTLALRPSGSLAGVVVDGNGRPVARAEVRAFPGSSARTRVRTSEAGAFRISSLSVPDDVELVAYRPGLAPALLDVTVGEPGSTELRLVLGRGRTARGRIVDDNGEPVAGARVEMTRNAASAVLDYSFAGDAGLYQGLTDDHGRFEITGLPERWFDLAVSHRNFLRLTLKALDLGRDIADGKAVDLGALALLRFPVAAALVSNGHARIAPSEPDEEEPVPEPEPAVTLTGRVLAPDGSPAPGAAVVCLGAGRRRDEADGDGRYEIRDLKAGSCMVLTRHETFGRRTVPAVELLPGENRVDVTLEPLKPPREIRGRVVDPEGNPVEGARVENSPEGYAAFTGADGSFLLKTDQTGFDLRVRKPGYAPIRLLDTAEDSADDEVELRLGREVFLSGRILGIDSSQLAWVEVSTASEGRSQTGGVGQDGVYRIPGLAPGTWEVVASLGDLRATGRIVIAPGEEEPVLNLEFHQEP